MFAKLPDLIDPVHCAEHNRRFQASVNQSEMKRLSEQLVSADKDVTVELAFKRHPKLKTPMFELSVKTQLELECQRTLDPYLLAVDSHVQGVFVSSMSMAEGLDENIEIYELPEGMISSLELVEDELLLAVPMVPRQQGDYLSWQDEPESMESDPEDEIKENPFAKLQQLKS